MISNKIVFLLILIEITFFIFLDTPGTIILFVFFGTLNTFISTLLRRKTSFYTKKEKTNQFIVNYLIITLLGQLVASSYYTSYGEYFAPFGDDSLYFQQAETYLPNLFQFDKLSLTGFLNHSLYSIISLIKNPNVLDLLCSHWGLAALINVFALDIACEFNKSKVQLKNLYLGLFSQAAYYFAMLSFYRDTYAILFLVLSIYYSLRQKNLLSIAFALSAGLIRGANGFYAIFFLTLNYIIKKNIFKINTSKTIFWSILTSFILLLSIPKVQEFIIFRGKNLFSENLGGIKLQELTIKSYISERQRSIIEDEGLYGSEGLGTGPKFYVKALLVPLISPGNLILLPYETRNINTYKKAGASYTFFSIHSVFSFFAMILLPFLLSKLLPALYLLFFKSTNSTLNLLVISFLFFYLAAAYISLVPRHYMAFIILIPALLSSLPKNFHIKYKTQSKSIIIVTSLFLILNTIKYIIT